MWRFSHFRPVLVLVILTLLLSPLAEAETRLDGTHEHGAARQHESSQSNLSPAGLTPEEELAYSLFMHHSSGLAVLVVGVLVLMDRLTGHRLKRIRLGMGLVWLIFGIHVFIRGDPEGWPLGPAGFLESFSMPTAGEWMQHKALSLLPLGLGIFFLVYLTRAPREHQASYGSYALAAVGLLGAAALLFHQHQDHPGMDVVNFQHRLMALAVLFVAASAVMETLDRFRWKVKPYLLPSGLILIGLQLALYVE